MKPYLVGALLLIGVVAWSCRANREWQDWERDKAATIASVKAREDSANRLLQVADSLFGYSVSQNGKAQQRFRDAERMVRSALHYRDSILTSLGPPPDTCAPFLRIARRTEDSLVGALRATQLAFDSLAGPYGLLERAYQAQLTRAGLLQSSTDSLVALVGRVPTPKRFQLVGVVGYGAVLSGGVVRTGPSVAVGIKVPF